MNSIVRCPRTGRACSEGACRERHWCRQLFERGLSPRGLPLKRKFRPRCCAKTRAGVPCITRVVPGKRRCRFHGGMSTGPKTKAGRSRIAEAQRRRWKAITTSNGPMLNSFCWVRRHQPVATGLFHSNELPSGESPGRGVIDIVASRPALPPMRTRHVRYRHGSTPLHSFGCDDRSWSSPGSFASYCMGRD